MWCGVVVDNKLDKAECCCLPLLIIHVCTCASQVAAGGGDKETNEERLKLGSDISGRFGIAVTH